MFKGMVRDGYMGITTIQLYVMVLRINNAIIRVKKGEAPTAE